MLLAIERAVATIRSSDPGEMPCHSVGTWHGPTCGEELLRSRTATEASIGFSLVSVIQNIGHPMRIQERLQRSETAAKFIFCGMSPNYFGNFQGIQFPGNHSHHCTVV